MIPFVRLILVCLLCLLGAATGAQEDGQPWYEVDGLNEGLGQAPERLDRSTPRAALRSFIDLTNAERYEWAAHALNLSNLPKGHQAKEGPRLAAMLASVIERRIWINWSGLSARPDAMIESETGNHPRAGATRRNIRIEMVEVNGRAYEVRLARYKAGGEEPVWLFTPQTVDDIPVSTPNSGRGGSSSSCPTASRPAPAPFGPGSGSPCRSTSCCSACFSGERTGLS
ncbi:MAG: hypothetical protein RIA08_04520 [Roseovarius sp.]|uniref:hypothetical protein n=1 Tax=Roseovarius sp. TaxID=1486281 RepID=UPI0032EB5DA3